jgi:alanine dehydrogenase
MKKVFGIPKELKTGETRVALTPDSVAALLSSADCEVLVETEAGALSMFDDEQYAKAGATIVRTAKELWEKSDYIIKVKEPQKCEFENFKEDQVIFSYFHLAVEAELTEALLKKKVCAIASESVQTSDGELPLLRPMSEVAGRMSIQIGARFLEKNNGGSGVLLGGVPGVQPGKVVVIGGGTVGINAAKVALGMGADVSILDINQKRLAEIDLLFEGRIKTHYCNQTTILEESKKADILVGAVLIPNKKAPKLVSADVIKQMKKGSVAIDVAIDQGGIIETMDALTTHDKPVYEKYGVLHCAIPNIPSAVPKTSSLAYSYAILPYVQKLAQLGTIMAIRECEPIRLGVNTFRGNVTCEALADSIGSEHTEISLLVGFKVNK